MTAAIEKVHEVEVLPPGAIVPQRVTFALHPEMSRMGDFAGRLTFAEQIHASGLAPFTLDTPAKIFVALQLGAELGLAPMYAIQNVSVVKGKPGLMYDAMLAVARSTGILEEYREELTDTLARIWFKRRGRPGFWSEFTFAEAEVAGLTKPSKSGELSMYTKYPKRMLRARAGSFGVKREFGDVLAGMYTPEELQEGGSREEANTSAPVVPPANAALAAPPKAIEAPKPPAEWRLTEAEYLSVKREIGRLKIAREDVNTIVTAATGGRDVPRVGGVPQFFRSEFEAIKGAVREWPTAPVLSEQLQGIQDAFVGAENPNAEPAPEAATAISKEA